MKLGDLLLLSLALKLGTVEEADLRELVGGERGARAALLDRGLSEVEIDALQSLRDARLARIAGSSTVAIPQAPTHTDDHYAQRIALDLGVARELQLVLDATLGDAPTDRVPLRDRPRREGTTDVQRYSVGPIVGRGGIGVVHAAYDRRLDREVALKVLRLDAHKAFVKRFIREGRLTGRLEHPNIVTVHDLGHLPDKRPFYCMKFIRGRDLGELLSLLRRGDEETRKSYGRVRLLSIFQAVCHGIAFAHERGVIHRDLKPRNIMIGEHGEVSIVDWGLAKTLGREDPSDERPRAPDPVDVAAEQAVAAALAATGARVALPLEPPVGVGEVSETREVPRADQVPDAAQPAPAAGGERPRFQGQSTILSPSDALVLGDSTVRITQGLRNPSDRASRATAISSGRRPTWLPSRRAACAT